MKIIDVINRLKQDRVKRLRRDTLLTWLSDFDERVYNQIILTHENSEPREFPYEDENTELIIPDMYGDIYKFYMESKIDFAFDETQRFQNNTAMFNGLYQNYADWYNRTHKPIQKNHIHFGGIKNGVQL